MADRVVKHGLFEYTDAKGQRAIAFRGDTITLDGDELARAEACDAVVASVEDLPVPLAEPEPDSVVEVSGPASSPAGAQLDVPDEDEEADLDGPAAPPKAATKDAWVDYRFAQDGRLSREQLNGLTKDELQDDAAVAALQPQD